ncbi:hypothetical protein ACS0TY_006828 [Phlomoides rotata]
MRLSWDLLRLLATQNNFSWLCAGDYNDIIFSTDKKERIPHPNWLFTGFRNAVNDCGFFYLPLIGYKFTWTRGRGSPNFVEERLDRAMGNYVWHGKIPHAKLLNLVAIVSDHTPILVDTTLCTIISHRRKSFCFEIKWLLEDGIGEVVKRSWSGFNDFAIMD